MDADFFLVRQFSLADIFNEAARAVAALFDLSAVLVKDSVFEVDRVIIGFFNNQNLIGTDAKMAVSQMSQLLFCEGKRFFSAVKHHEVVSCSVHFREFNFHSVLNG